MSSAVVVAGSFLATLVLVPVLIRYALRRDLLDVPNERSSHTSPTPRLGGLAVMVGIWLAAPRFETVLPLLYIATLCGLVGLLDDLVDLRFWLKFLGQAGAAGMLLLWSPSLRILNDTTLEVPGFLLAMFWIVALVNAFNFMDGIDGIAASTALVSAFVILQLSGSQDLRVALTTFFAANLAFLLWNLSPARIFLGDAGSHFIGFFLAGATLTVTGSTSRSIGDGPVFDLISFVVLALLFTPFLFDTAWTLVRRARAGRNLFEAHREHVYQRISRNPEDHRRATNIYTGLAMISGIAAIIGSRGTPIDLGMSLALVLSVITTMSMLPRLLDRRST